MTDTDFSKATERPWFYVQCDDGAWMVCTEGDIVVVDDSHLTEANAALIVAAVNAFDPEREKKVEALVEAIEEVIAATGAYLPPDGISPQECLNRILGATDNKKIVDALHSLKGGENG